MRSLVRALFAIVSLVAVSATHAAEIKPYDKATFDALEAAGKPVVIHVYADWCPTCKEQTPIRSDLIKEPSFKAKRAR
jgi:thioredoxin 1